MKKIFLSILILFFSTTYLIGGQIQAYLSYAVFNTPDNQPYIETYLVVKGSTLEYVPTDEGNYKAALDIQIIFSIGDSIVNFGKYELAAPIVIDTLKVKENILDVQRYSLPQGEYTMEFSLKDQNDIKEASVNTNEFSVDFPEKEMSFSDVEFLHSFKKTNAETILNKGGYELVPYVFNFFPQVVKELTFYAELYESNKVVDEDQFILYYYIRPFEVDKKLDQFFYMKKMSGKDVSPLLNSIDINNLPSGNYLLVLETRDRNNQILAQKETFFQRENENVEFNLNKMLVADLGSSFVNNITSRDSILLYIDYLYPISTDTEKSIVKSIVRNDDFETLQYYFLHFWIERNAEDPEKAWNDYHELVKKANHNFRSITIAGYKTDRGRVFLQYGPPNNMAKSYNEPAAFPYEIWQYYVLQGQRDKKFVFYTRDIATKDFQLIHSNARGELANYRWQATIYGRTWDPHNLDEFMIPDSYGSFSTDYYVQPR